MRKSDELRVMSAILEALQELEELRECEKQMQKQTSPYHKNPLDDEWDDDDDDDYPFTKDGEDYLN